MILRVSIFWFTICGDFTWRGVWPWRISGGYSQGNVGVEFKTIQLN